MDIKIKITMGNGQTQGEIKMKRYIEDLIRNKEFKKYLKKIRKYRKIEFPVGNYDDWTEKQKKQSDNFDKEIKSIHEGYELLRKRCKKLKSKYWKVKEQVAENYSLDDYLIEFALALSEKNKFNVELFEINSEPDMCRLFSIYEEEQANPIDKGEEIVYLRPSRQLRNISFPVSIAINSRASKRDVLDFIEKRWKLVESLREGKTLKIRKRKYSQAFLDFLWEIRSLPLKQIKKKIDENYNKSLVYFEINQLIQTEKKKRNKKLS